jgi:hypothetical protein
MTKNIIKVRGYSNPHIESLLTDLNVYSTETLRLKAIQDAEFNRSDTEQDWKVSVFNPIQAQIQLIIHAVMQKLTPITRNVVRNSILAETKDIETVLSKQIHDKELEEAGLSKQVQTLKPCSSEACKRWLVRFFVFIVSTADAYLTFDSCTAYRIPFIASVVFAVLNGATIGLGTHFLADSIMKSKTPAIMRLRVLGGIVFATIIFTLLGVARASLYNYRPNYIQSETTTHTTSTPTISAIVLIVISVFFFIAALFFSCKVWLAKEERDAIRKYNDKNDDLKKASCALKDLKKTKEEVRDYKNNQLTELDEKTEYGVGAIKTAIGQGEIGLATYAEAYRRNSPYKPVPAYFTNPPKFSFNFSNDPIQ